MSVIRIAILCSGLVLILGAASPAVAAGDRDHGDEGSGTSDELQRLEREYQETGDLQYLYQRVLLLEEMGESEFALQIIRDNYEGFQSHPEIDGVALTEQRLVEVVAGPENDRVGRTSDAFGWILTGGGLATSVSGVLVVASAEATARRLQCSPQSSAYDPRECRGVESYEGLTRRGFEDKSAAVGRSRWVGVGLITLGLAATSWGMYRLISHESQPRGAEASLKRTWSTFRPMVSADGVGASLHLQF